MVDNKNELGEKKYKTFTDYYKDPEYKKKHKEYMSQKVECKYCKKIVTRSNMTNHLRTLKCINVRDRRRKTIDNINKLYEILKVATNDVETAKKLKEKIFSL